MVLKKERVFFPKKGPKKKALMFLSNISRIPSELRKKVYLKVLRKKSKKERIALMNARKVFSSRKEIFLTFENLVSEYRKKHAGFLGVIIFGGVVKKSTPPTDIDFIFVGNLSDNAKKTFCQLLWEKTQIPVNPFPVKIDVVNDPKVFNKLLSVPYLHFPREWTVQNFIGPIEVKRKLQKSYDLALKQLAKNKQKIN